MRGRVLAKVACGVAWMFRLVGVIKWACDLGMAPVREVGTGSELAGLAICLPAERAVLTGVMIGGVRSCLSSRSFWAERRPDSCRNS